MEQIQLVYGLPIETIEFIMMLYKQPKVKLHPPNANTHFLGFDHEILTLFIKVK